MIAYELTQSMMAVGTVYHVRRPREEEVLYTIRGATVAGRHRFSLATGDDGPEVGSLDGNAVQTHYAIANATGATLADVSFPTVAFERTLTLTLTGAEGRTYAASGGVFHGVFECKDEEGRVALEIAKAFTIRDTFTVKAREDLPFQVGLLAAVAIHSRFYLMVTR